jgi:hypothetical protein
VLLLLNVHDFEILKICIILIYIYKYIYIYIYNQLKISHPSLTKLPINTAGIITSEANNTPLNKYIYVKYVASSAPAATPSNIVCLATTSPNPSAAVLITFYSVVPASVLKTLFPIASNFVVPPVLISLLPYANDPETTPPTVDSSKPYYLDTFLEIDLTSFTLNSPPLF